VSKASRLGYDAEHAVQVFLAKYGFASYRPRAGTHQDTGDLTGLPVVVSVKNHARTELAEWVDALRLMTSHAGLDLGVVWHKRRGRGDPADWYVTTTGEHFMTLLRAYREHQENQTSDVTPINRRSER
jgi:hypothetical protein